MRARSVVGALLIALTSHLWFTQAVSACANHSRTEAVADPSNHSADGGAQSAHHQSEPDKGHRHNDDAGTRFQCCQALASCGMSPGLAAATSLAALEVHHLTTQLTLTASPTSQVAAPDPPPPRA